MPISEAQVGRTYPATAAYDITAVKVAEFAAALGDADNPAYRGDDAVAPPTFAVVLAAATWDSLFGDPELELSLRRTVHADQRFTWDRPLRVGDLVQAQLTIDKVRYAGASGDFNPIHYNDAAAAALGLPGVIAHGMLTMGTALRVVTDWIGDPTRVLSYYVRFTKPVVVPATETVEVTFTGTITGVSGEVATVAIEAVCDQAKVLGSVCVEVRID